MVCFSQCCLVMNPWAPPHLAPLPPMDLQSEQPQPPLRPNFGQSGRAILLRANHFQVPHTVCLKNTTTNVVLLLCFIIHDDGVTVLSKELNDLSTDMGSQQVHSFKSAGYIDNFWRLSLCNSLLFPVLTDRLYSCVSAYLIILLISHTGEDSHMHAASL